MKTKNTKIQNTKKNMKKNPKKKIKVKLPIFTFTKNDTSNFVHAKNSEAAAMKIYRMHKSYYAELGYVHVTNEAKEEYNYPVSNWCCPGNSRKFQSKPK
jgi:hypothetical protein